MKFYLVYRNHGLYDPILDESDDIYVPIGPNDLDQDSNLQQLREVQIESKESTDISKPSDEFTILVPSMPYRPHLAGSLEESIIFLNSDNVFPELNLEELPPGIKYKLPISDHYDPEGKKIENLQEIYRKNIIVDLKTLTNFSTHGTKIIQKEKDTATTILNDKDLFSSKEEYKLFKTKNEEIVLSEIENTASHIVEDSLIKALSVAKQLKSRRDEIDSESCEPKELKKDISLPKTSVQSMQTKVKTCNQLNRETENLLRQHHTVSFEDVRREDTTELTSDELILNEISVAKEIERIEMSDIQIDSKLNAEKRKLLTLQDVEEAIEAGTVNQRTEMFKKESHKVMLDKIGNKTCDISVTNIELAKQRVYNIGLQVLPNIRAAIKPSCNWLLNRFLVQLSKIMIRFAKFLPVKAKYNITKIKKSDYEKNEDQRFKTQKMRENFEEINYNNLDYGTGKGPEIIKKPKLSGAKIAQIEGLKPAELTDKMNIVISEFLRKSGNEDKFEEEVHVGSHRSQPSKSANETEDNFNASSYRQETVFDDKKTFEETYESKSQTLEIREMKSEKRFSESKYSQFDSKVKADEEEYKTSGDGNLTYIAIVEAHVYTNKNAIFEEQMRQMRDSVSEFKTMESGIIYYKCEVTVTYKDFREASLAPTVVIESIEEIPSDEVFEVNKQDISQISDTGIEEIAKKIAVQKITEVIEPLVSIKEVKSVNIKQTYPTIEMPLKSMAETTTLQVGFIDIAQPIIQTPESVIESTLKSVAEINEVIVDEADIKTFELSKPVENTPQFTFVENPQLNLPETAMTFVEEPICQELTVPNAITKEAKTDIMANFIAEITEVSLHEKEQNYFDAKKVILKEPDTLKEESILTVCETATVLTLEPKEELFMIDKTVNQQANVIIEESKAIETTVVHVEQPKEKNLEAFAITGKQSQSIDYKVRESNAAITSIVYLEEPKEEKLEVRQDKEQNMQISSEDSSLTVAKVLEILPEGPNDEVLVTAKPELRKADMNTGKHIAALTTVISVQEEPENKNLELFMPTKKMQQSITENPVLSVAETLTILPEEPHYDNFDTDAIMKDQANITFDEIKPLTVNIVCPDESHENDVDFSKIAVKQSQTLIEERFLTVAEASTVEPEEYRNDIYVITKPGDEKAKVNLQVLKTAEVSEISVGGPREEELEVLKYDKKKPQTLMESFPLTVPETFEVTPNETKDDNLKIILGISENANVTITELKGTRTTIVYAEEPKEENFEIPLIKTINHDTAIEEVNLSAAEISLVLPEEPQESFDEPKILSQQAHLEVIEQKATETMFVLPFESKCEDLVIPEIEKKIPHTVLEGSILTVAESLSVIFDENVGKVETSTITSQKTNIDLEGLIAPQTNIGYSEEPRLEMVEVSQLIKKESQPNFIDVYFVVAENNVIVPLGPKEGVLKISKTETQLARLKIIEFKVAEKSIIFIGENVNEEFIASVLGARESDISVEKSLKMVATITAVEVSEAGTEFSVLSDAISKRVKIAFDTFTPVSQTIITVVENAANYVNTISKLTTTQAKSCLVDLAATDVAFINDIKYSVEVGSPSSSTVSSAPSTPLIEEYVFGVFGVKSREYRVQSPQETSLDIKTVYKDSKYEIQNVDNSYTLILEAATEQDIQIIDEEVSGLEVRKSQFWISDIKTTESIESSDANLQIMKMNLGLQAAAGKDNSKYLSVQDSNSALAIRSRSHSFDQSAEFEASLQSLEVESRVKETQDDLELATYEFTSGASKSLVDIQSTEANINIKSKAIKQAAVQSMDVALTIEKEVSLHDQSIDLDMNASYDTKSMKSSKRQVKKTSDYEMEMGADYKQSISSKSSLSTTKNIESGTVSDFEVEMQGNFESSTISKGSRLAMKSNLESSSVLEANNSAIMANLDSSTSSEATYSSAMHTNLEMAAQHSLYLQSDMSNESRQNLDARQKLSLQIGSADMKSHAITNGFDSLPPTPSTPLTDEYMFRLRTPVPEETQFIPRDCSFTPESVHEEPLVIINGMVPHIKSRIIRVLYSPPLQSPRTSPEKKAEPVFTKPGLKGGALVPEFTKEEILEIGRKSALLASAIDKTIRSIEEYKESVGITKKTEENEEKSKVTCTGQSTELCLGEAAENTTDIRASKVKKLEVVEFSDKKASKSESVSDAHRTKNNSNKSCKKKMELLSRFSQI